MRIHDLDQIWPYPSQASTLVERPLQTRSQDAGQQTLRASGIGAVPFTDGFSRPTDDLDVRATDTASHFESSHLRAKMARAAAAVAFVRGFDPKAAIWLSLGFVSGMVAWHAVGFWGFVSTAVLSGSDRPATIASAPAPERERSLVNFNSVVVVPPSGASDITTSSLATFVPQQTQCSALIRAPNARETSLTACPQDAAPLRDAGRRRRGDRLPSAEVRLHNASTWASTTETSSANERAPNEAGLNSSDFNLSLVTDD
jgi:hypothetical protein